MQWTLVGLVLAGCSMGKDSSDQNTAQIRENKKVTDLYGPLVGTYDGKLFDTDHGDEDVQLVIYLSSQTVTNPDGTPGSKNVPQAYFRRSHPVIADYQMDVSGLTSEQGDFSMRNLGSDAEVRTIQAHFSANTITGSVLNARGTLGRLELKLTSKDTSSHDDYKDRLLTEYEAIEGEYENAGTEGSMPHMSITLQAVVNGDTPRLAGQYKNLDVPGGYVDLPLTVTYDPNLSPPSISMNGKGSGRYELNMNGTVIGDEITIDVDSLYQGYLGQTVLKRTNVPIHDPHDRDLYHRYQAVQGSYVGFIGDKKSKTKVQVALTASLTRAHKPVLNATYSTFNGNKATPSIMDSTSYEPGSGVIAIQGTDNSGHAVQLAGSLKNRVLKVSVTVGGVVVGSGSLKFQK